MNRGVRNGSNNRRNEFREETLGIKEGGNGITNSIVLLNNKFSLLDSSNLIDNMEKISEVVEPVIKYSQIAMANMGKEWIDTKWGDAIVEIAGRAKVSKE